MKEINRRSFTVTNVTATTFELQTLDATPVDFDTTGWTAYVSGGEVRKKVDWISNLDHLEGETVSILADGAVLPNQVVSGGVISLQSKKSHVHVGLAYSSRFESLPIVADLSNGTTMSKRGRVREVAINFIDTLGAKAGAG